LTSTVSTLDTSSPGTGGELAIAARLDELADLVFFRDNPEVRSLIRTLTDRELAIVGISPDDPRPLLLIALIDGELWRRAIPFFVTAPAGCVMRVPITQVEALEIATWAKQVTDLVMLPMPSIATH
jgi:hypothetical protein